MSDEFDATAAVAQEMDANALASGGETSTLDGVKGDGAQLFCSEVEIARYYRAEAAEVLENWT